MPITVTENALTMLSAATQALIEAETAYEIKPLMDFGEQAILYAKQHGYGLDAQNSAAEYTLDCGRKLGWVLAQLERGHNQYDAGACPTLDEQSEYRAVLEDIGISRQAANRWWRRRNARTGRL